MHVNGALGRNFSEINLEQIWVSHLSWVLVCNTDNVGPVHCMNKGLLKHFGR